MQIFVWNERYVTGEAIVDSEHRELVRLINWVIEHQSTATPAGEIENVLGQLVQYAMTHFSHEEQLMASVECDPRFFSLHQNLHRDFASQIGKMREFPDAGADLGFLLRFLSSWLAHHILGTAQSMARHIRKIRAGMAPAQAYDEESQIQTDPATATLLEGMNTLFRLVAARNSELQKSNASLESQVALRTRALSESNEQLLLEQGRLKLAMQQVEITQKKLLESEHRRAETSKRNMEQLLAQIIESDPVPTFVIDAEHRVTHWNTACAKISGLSAAEMVGSRNQWRAFYPT